MNRRKFFSSAAIAAAGLTMLPPSETFQGVWRHKTQPVCTTEEVYEFVRAAIEHFREARRIHWKFISQLENHHG